MFHKGKKLVGIPHATLRKDALRHVFTDMLLAERYKTVLEPEARADTPPLVLAAKITSLLVESKDLLHPGADFVIARVFLPQFLQVPYEMHPAALMLAQVVIVSTVKIADQDTLEPLSQRRFGYKVPAARVPDVEAGSGIGRSEERRVGKECRL